MASLISTLGADAKEILNFEPRVSDVELMTEKPYELIVGGFSSKPPVEGSTYTSPILTWHGYGAVGDRWIQRTVKGRSHLHSLLLSQCQGQGLAFVNVATWQGKALDPNNATGEVTATPNMHGAFNLVFRKGGEPALLVCLVSIDKTKGKAANQGAAYIYKLEAFVRPVKLALEKIPSLPVAGAEVLALTDDEAPESEDRQEGGKGKRKKS